jgi:DNA-binding transcriptional LysR family regulator
MDLRQLEILKAVAETGSFTGAGRRLHVSQSAISRQILLLEAELNEPLFWRIKRKVKITPAGEALLQLSLRVFDDIRETTERLSETQQRLTGTIRLVGGMTVSIYVFPTLLKEFQRLHPDVDVKVMTGPADRLVRRLRAGTVDLGLLTLPVNEPDLVTRPVMREELLLVTYPGHPLSQKKKIESQDLNKLPFILYESGSNTRRVIDEFFVREQVQPRIVMETENVEILKALVRSEMGITIIPYQAVAREVRSRQLFCARISGAHLVRHTGWVYLRSSKVPRMMEEMFKAYQRILPKLNLSPGGRNGSLSTDAGNWELRSKN